MACGNEHTIALTLKGEVYVMGSNTQGQLGTGPPSRGSPMPILLEELTFARMIKIRAGSFSAALSSDHQMFVWGRGIFGEFYTPHRIKSINKLDILDYEISRNGLAVILTRQGTVYSWGANDFGQLGHGDYKSRATPERIDALDGKRVSQIAIGNDFVIALGLTLPQREYTKEAVKRGTKILRTNGSQISTKKSGSKSQRNKLAGGKLSSRKRTLVHGMLN